MGNEAIVSSIGTEDEEEAEEPEEEPEEESEEDEEKEPEKTFEESREDTATPGFEPIILILAVSIILFLKRKKPGK